VLKVRVERIPRVLRARDYFQERLNAREWREVVAMNTARAPPQCSASPGAS